MCPRGRVGVWRSQPWAAGVVVLLGACVAAMWLVEGFVLGIVAYLYAPLVAVLAIVVALVIAAYVNRQHERGSTDRSRGALRPFAALS